MSQVQSCDHTNEKIATQKIPNEEATSQYQIRPSIGKQFPVVAIREIINEVLLQILDGKIGSDFCNNMHVFYLFYLKNPSGKEYAGKEVGSWCKQIVNDINRRIKDLEIPRYKHIVQIMLSEQTGAGCRYVILMNQTLNK